MSSGDRPRWHGRPAERMAGGRETVRPFATPRRLA